MTGAGGEIAWHGAAVAGRRVVEWSLPAPRLSQPQKRDPDRPTDRPAGLMDASGFCVPSPRSSLLLTLPGACSQNVGVDGAAARLRVVATTVSGRSQRACPWASTRPIGPLPEGCQRVRALGWSPGTRAAVPPPPARPPTGGWGWHSRGSGMRSAKFQGHTKPVRTSARRGRGCGEGGCGAWKPSVLPSSGAPGPCGHQFPALPCETNGWSWDKASV
jgi:hypothetical protein